MADQDNQSAEIISPPPEQASDRGHRDRARRRQRNPPRHLEASINMNELRELIGLITENGLTQFELEREGFRVKIGRGHFLDESAASAKAKLTRAETTITSGCVGNTSAVQRSPTSAPQSPG